MAESAKTSIARRPWLHEHGLYPRRGHIFAFFDKTLYNDYLCLVASNKQQIYVARSQTSAEKFENQSTPKQIRIRRKDSATVAFSW